MNTEDFSLPDDFIFACAKDHVKAERELYRKLIDLLSAVSNIKMTGPNGAMLAQKIKDARRFLALNKDNMQDGFLINEIGMHLFRFSKEIYERDADNFFKNYRTILRDEISGNAEISQVIDAVSVVYKTISEEELMYIFKILTHIVDIVGASTMK